MPGYTSAGGPKKSGAGLQTVIVLVVLAAVGVGIYFAFFRGNEPGRQDQGGRNRGAGTNGKQAVTPPEGNAKVTGAGKTAAPVPAADIPGRDEFKKRDFKGAAARLAEHVKGKGKADPAAHYMLGRSYNELGKTDLAEKTLSRAVALDPRGANGGAAALILGDMLWGRYYARPDEQDRTRWERIREVYSVALRTAGFGADRDQLVARLEKLNAYLLWTRMSTSDSTMYSVMPGDSVERIAVARGLPRDCARSISRINKLRSDHISVGQKLKIIAPLKMEYFVSKQHLKLTVFLNGYFFGEFPVGIGKGGSTPLGEYKLTTKDKNPDWTQTLPDGQKKVWKFGTKENILGTRWMGMEDKPAVGAIGLGVHGTTQPKTVPGRESAGCVRMLNKDVELLYDFTPSGTKVVITK